MENKYNQQVINMTLDNMIKIKPSFEGEVWKGERHSKKKIEDVI